MTKKQFLFAAFDPSRYIYNTGSPAWPAVQKRKVRMKDRIIQAQRQILNDLAAHESMIGELYDMYATMHPQSSSMWSALAKEEREHSSMLTAMNKLLDNGNLFWNLGGFAGANVAEQLTVIHTAVDRARNSKPSESECIETAVRIEASLLDSKFYSVVTSEAKDFTYVCQALSRETEKHLQQLKDKIAEKAEPRLDSGYSWEKD